MWNTPMGHRVLAGAEAELFRAALTSLVIWSEEEDDHEVGVRVFDELEPSSKLAMLEQVARALLVKAIPAPVHTAVNEGTIAAIYDQLLMDLDLECSDGEGDLRQLVMQACKECHTEGAPSEACSVDEEKWAEAVEELTFRILWDSDWESERSKDYSPRISKHIRANLGIDDGYYVAIAPDPSPAELRKMLDSLRELCGPRLDEGRSPPP
jgi:hypothetical protein